jgi:hypothetical protein
MCPINYYAFINDHILWSEAEKSIDKVIPETKSVIKLVL